MKIREFFKSAKAKIILVLTAIGAAILVILGIRKGKSNKQIKNNEEITSEIKQEKSNIKKEVEEIKQEISEAKKVVKEAEKHCQSSKNTSDDVNKQIKKNNEILEKYKK